MKLPAAPPPLFPRSEGAVFYLLEAESNRPQNSTEKADRKFVNLPK
jgi:hypothetical protein